MNDHRTSLFLVLQFFHFLTKRSPFPLGTEFQTDLWIHENTLPLRRTIVQFFDRTWHQLGKTACSRFLPLAECKFLHFVFIQSFDYFAD